MFHAGVPYFSGGFVGVDIFFVISGYLITLWIKDKLAEGNFSFGKFYVNRLRRLAPTFFVVLVFVWIAGFFLAGADEFLSLGKSLTSSLAFVSNWYFLGQTGYFDPALETNALLHSWSLSVEEQFYLVWPLLLVFLWPGVACTSRKLMYTVLGLIALSLIASVILVAKGSAQQAFFNSIGRIWELLAGAVLALGFVRGPRTPAMATGMRCLGLILLMMSIGFYSRRIAYPGAAALAPILGTFFMIAASDTFRDPIFHTLSSMPFRFIGKISYSLYLWHWPLLVYAKSQNPELSALALTMVLAAAFALAAGSTFLFEMPIRRRYFFKRDEPFLAVAGMMLVMFVSLGVFTVSAKGMPDRWEDSSFSETVEDLHKGLDLGRCFIDAEPLENLTATCLEPVPAKKNILVIGDSFAAHLMPGLKYHFPEYHFVQATASGCRALVNFYLYGEHHCPELNKLLFSSTIKDRRYDAIFLISDWANGDQVTETLAAIRAQTTAPVVVFGNTPVYKVNPSNGLRKHTVSGAAMTTERPVFRDHLWSANETLRESATGASFISLLENFCQDRKCPLLTKDGKNVHFDWGHLTEWGSIAMVGASQQHITNALGILGK